MLTLAFAQSASQAAPKAAQSPILSLMPIAIIFIIFYFLLIKPQKKQQKEHAKIEKGEYINLDDFKKKHAVKR